MPLRDVAIFALWMLPWLGIALAILYAGYVAHQASLAREQARAAPSRGADPALELAQINHQIADLTSQARASLEQARDALRSGIHG